MSAKKITIVVLVIIGILFVVGQGGGLFREPGIANEDKEGQKDASKKLEGGWVDAIKDGLGGFGFIDDIDMNRIPKLTSDCVEVESKGHYTFSAGAVCMLEVNISDIPGDDKQLVKLSVEGCDQERGSARPARIGDIAVMIPGAPVFITGGGSQDGPSPASGGWPGLNVSYKPANADKVDMDKPWVCGDEPLTLIISPKGGKLTMVCEKCTPGKKLTLRFE